MTALPPEHLARLDVFEEEGSDYLRQEIEVKLIESGDIKTAQTYIFINHNALPSHSIHTQIAMDGPERTKLWKYSAA